MMESNCCAACRKHLNTMKWRKQNPLRMIWSRFVQRLKRKLRRNINLSWDHYGKILLLRAIDTSSLSTEELQTAVLTWERNTTCIDLTRLKLVSLQTARHLCKPTNHHRQDSYNKQYKCNVLHSSKHLVQSLDR